MFIKVGNENEQENHVIIYGAGYDGILTFITLLNLGIYVAAFCDQDVLKQSMRIMNKKVISPEELFSCEDKEHLVIYIGSSLYHKEILKKLLENGFREIYENVGGGGTTTGG